MGHVIQMVILRPWLELDAACFGAYLVFPCNLWQPVALGKRG